MDFFIVCQLGPSANIRENILLGNIMGKNSDPRMEPWGTPFFFISYIVFFFFLSFSESHTFTFTLHLMSQFKVSKFPKKIFRYGMERFIVDKCYSDVAHHSHVGGIAFIKLILWLPDKKVFFNMLRHVIQCKKSLYSNTIALCIPIFLYSGWLQKPEERYWKT